MDPAFLDVDGEHQHDNRVSSVGFNQPGELDMDKTNSWIAKLLQLEGNNIYRYASPLLTTSLLFNLKKILPTAPDGRVWRLLGRMKGVLAMAGISEKFVYQGVHMQFKVSVLAAPQHAMHARMQTAQLAQLSGNR